MGPKEYKDMMDYLTRPRMADGERMMLSNGGIAEELKLFVEEFKKTNERIPTQNEIFQGTGRASKTIKSYLTEGQDFAKTLTKKEAAKLGGRKVPTSAVTDLSDDLIDQFKNLKFTHISPTVDTTAAGSKKFRVKFSGPIANDFKEIYLDATKENLRKISNQLDDIVTGNLYKNKAKQFKTPEQFRKLRRLKDAMYREKDPYGIYEQLRKYKSKVFPGSASMDIQIQHGQPKFSTQTLSRFGFIPKEVNISPEVEKVERIRNEKLDKISRKLKSKNISIGDKKNLIDEFNNTMKGLRGQLKGTGGQGLVNFELLDIDQDGNVTKLKDTGFDPKRGLIASNEDLSKITKKRADELIKLGKQKIDAEAVRLNLVPASKLAVPKKTKTREMFEAANKRLGERGSIDRQLLTDATKGLGKAGTFAFDKVVRPLGTRAAGSLFAADQVRRNIQSGENVADAVLDPLVGLELSFPGLFKENVSKITTNPTAQKLLNLGRFARLTTPVGLGITAAGLGIDAYKASRDRLNFLDTLTPDQKTELFRKERQQAVMQNLRGGRNAFDEFSAAGGGIAKEAGDSSGRPPVRGPNSQGLQGLMKRGRRI